MITKNIQRTIFHASILCLCLTACESAGDDDNNSSGDNSAVIVIEGQPLAGYLGCSHLGESRENLEATLTKDKRKYQTSTIGDKVTITSDKSGTHETYTIEDNKVTEIQTIQKWSLKPKTEREAAVPCVRFTEECDNWSKTYGAPVSDDRTDYLTTLEKMADIGLSIISGSFSMSCEWSLPDIYANITLSKRDDNVSGYKITKNIATI